MRFTHHQLVQLPLLDSFLSRQAIKRPVLLAVSPQVVVVTVDTS